MAIIVYETCVGHCIINNQLTLALGSASTRSEAKSGDYVIGLLPSRRVLYLGCVGETLSREEYSTDPRFEDRIPCATAPTSTMRHFGDNMYFLDDRGEWVQHHDGIRSEEDATADLTECDRVLIFDMNETVYYGKDHIQLPKDMAYIKKQLPRNSKKCKVMSDARLIKAVQRHMGNAEKGVLAYPIGFETIGARYTHRECHRALEEAMDNVLGALEDMSDMGLWKSTTSRPNASGYSHTSGTVRRGFKCDSMVFGLTCYGRNKPRPALANSTCPDTLDALNAMAECLGIDPKGLSFTLNRNFQCKAHLDGTNVGETIIVALGDYRGGELVIEGKRYDIHRRPLVFYGGIQKHWVGPFEGTRYSVVMYKRKATINAGKKVKDMASNSGKRKSSPTKTPRKSPAKALRRSTSLADINTVRRQLITPKPKSHKRLRLNCATLSLNRSALVNPTQPTSSRTHVRAVKGGIVLQLYYPQTYKIRATQSVEDGCWKDAGDYMVGNTKWVSPMLRRVWRGATIEDIQEQIHSNTNLQLVIVKKLSARYGGGFKVFNETDGLWWIQATNDRNSHAYIFDAFTRELYPGAGGVLKVPKNMSRETLKSHLSHVCLDQIQRVAVIAYQ